MPRELALAMALTAWMWSWERIAVCILVAFQALLRSAEIGNLRRGDIVLPADMGGEPGTAIISIRHSKTTSRAARLQSALVDDEPLVMLLQRVCVDDEPVSLFLR
eukprot:2845222-Amphidinium_carterae.1